MKSLSAELFEQQQPLLVEIAGYGNRPIADIYPHSKGAAFLDIGWAMPLRSSHPAHLLEGALEGNGPWKVGPHTVRLIRAGERELGEVLAWREWQRSMLEAGKDYATREAGEEFVRAEFGQ